MNLRNRFWAKRRAVYYERGRFVKVLGRALLLIDWFADALQFHAVLLDITLHFVEELLGPRAAPAERHRTPSENRAAGKLKQLLLKRID